MQTLSRLERLRASPEFTAVLRRGRCYRSPALRIHFRENGRARSRLGLVVGRKVGNAVVRNRVKRRLRAAFRLEKARIPVPLDLVAVASPEHGEGSLADYQKVFVEFLRWHSSRK
jgi:ribonuclease P protein component